MTRYKVFQSFPASQGLPILGCLAERKRPDNAFSSFSKPLSEFLSLSSFNNAFFALTVFEQALPPPESLHYSFSNHSFARQPSVFLSFPSFTVFQFFCNEQSCIARPAIAAPTMLSYYPHRRCLVVHVFSLITRS